MIRSFNPDDTLNDVDRTLAGPFLLLLLCTGSGLRQLELYLPHTVSVWVVH
jgi:hypothetical protein